MLLSEEMPRFTFPPVSSLEQLGVLFKVMMILMITMNMLIKIMLMMMVMMVCSLEQLGVLFKVKQLDFCRRVHEMIIISRENLREMLLQNTC